jgi:hypothetical protein
MAWVDGDLLTRGALVSPWVIIFPIILLILKDYLGVKWRNGNGSDGVALKSIRGWLDSKGDDIHMQVIRGVSKLDRLIEINQQQLEADQDYYQKQDRRHQALVNAMWRDGPPRE